jgi:hypothetical protein
MPNINIIPLDPANLYRRDFYTDGKAGTVVEKTPVQITAEGEVIMDASRAVLYDGQTYLNGQLIEFPIRAGSLGEAIAKFAPSVGGVIQELQSQQIQQRIAKPLGQNGNIVLDVPSRKRS